MVQKREKSNARVARWAIAKNNQELSAQTVTKNLARTEGKTAVVIGAGIGGLTAAYELLDTNHKIEKCIILEASDRVGGRSLTVRPGDTIQENTQYGQVTTQICTFDAEAYAPSAPYLNAGPGRIPSTHKLLLDYMREFKVPMEVYVMNSASNLVYTEGSFDDESVPYRQLEYNMQGWVSQLLYDLLDDGIVLGLKKKEMKQLKSFLQTFGQLDEDGQYADECCCPNCGTEKCGDHDRAGYNKLPGVEPGQIAPAKRFRELIRSEFWSRTNFYQHMDILWQPTSFQPVGGMDQIVHAFAHQVKQRGGEIRLNTAVNRIEYDQGTYKIYCEGQDKPIEADYCISNVPIPLLEKILDANHFSCDFRKGLDAVYKAQNDGIQEDNGYIRRFLADSTKVGWQAKRSLWQEAEGEGDVPIYGGISRTTHEIGQIWYPSDNYHAELGVLTGAYNYGQVAQEWGFKAPQERLRLARDGARSLGGDAFADGLKHGLAIAWQNIAHIQGAWAQWHVLGDHATKHFNRLVQGDNGFYIVGDQMSNLSGWQEGAVASAINAVRLITSDNYFVPKLAALPDTRLTVEGAYWVKAFID